MCPRTVACHGNLAVVEQLAGQLGLGFVAALPCHFADVWECQPASFGELVGERFLLALGQPGGGLGDARGDPSFVECVAQGRGQRAQPQAPADRLDAHAGLGGDLLDRRGLTVRPAGLQDRFDRAKLAGG